MEPHGRRVRKKRRLSGTIATSLARLCNFEELRGPNVTKELTGHLMVPRNGHYELRSHSAFDPKKGDSFDFFETKMICFPAPCSIADYSPRFSSFSLRFRCSTHALSIFSPLFKGPSSTQMDDIFTLRLLRHPHTQTSTRD